MIVGNMIISSVYSPTFDGNKKGIIVLLPGCAEFTFIIGMGEIVRTTIQSPCL